MTPTTDPERRVRVEIVDDSSVIRQLLRMSFELDGRFEVVGEAGDGEEAVAVAGATQPDLVVLDRQMPVMDGVTALPLIREQAPNSAVVMYTAGGDAGAYQAAVSAGALTVIDKLSSAGSVVDDIADVLVSHWAAPGATVEIRVGPVSSVAARAWVANTRTILDTVQAHAASLGVDLAPEVVGLFKRLLDDWADLARTENTFRWVARASAEDTELLVSSWQAIDSLDDETMERLGLAWSGPPGDEFYRALTAGVLSALAAHHELAALARRLKRRWAD